VREDCRIWDGPRAGQSEYGQTTVNGVRWYVHRIAYTRAYGPIPDGMVVMHSCDTPLCYNPEHLSVGTQGDNLDDMRAKGRSNQAIGSRLAHTKVTEQDVRDMRLAHAAGETVASIARRYRQNPGATWRMVKGETWKHVVV
jgi:hypothetical protein